MRPPVHVRAIRAYCCDTGLGRSYVFVVVETDTGVSGYGEASQSGQDAAVLANVDLLAQTYIGHDLFELIERRSRLYRSGRAGRAMFVAASGIEIALWDAIGKVLDVPVYRLLGGSAHDTIKCYATIAPLDRDSWTPDELAEAAAATVDSGYSAIKIVPFGRQVVDQMVLPATRDLAPGIARVAAVREAVGDEVDIMIECAFRLDRTTALAAAERLGPYGCFWLEAPFAWDDPSELATLRQATSIRIASGELLHGLQAFAPLIEGHAVDVLQPDVKWAGGILETKKIAASAEAHQVAVALHNNSGPVATAASGHLSLTLPNALTLEVAARQPAWADELVAGSGIVRAGTLNLDDVQKEPGLGIQFDESVARAVATSSMAKEIA